jgi:hypothetical protein
LHHLSEPVFNAIGWLPHVVLLLCDDFYALPILNGTDRTNSNISDSYLFMRYIYKRKRFAGIMVLMAIPTGNAMK